MCHFPSWSEDKDNYYFLNDAEAKQVIRNNRGRGFNHMVDCVGHSAIRRHFGNVGTLDKELFPVPKPIQNAIETGKMNELMNAYGYGSIKLDNKGNLHCADGPAVVHTDGQKEYFVHGKKMSLKRGKMVPYYV